MKNAGGYGVVIGHDVWIGERCVICSRVQIGNGAIIAAGSVVTHSIPSYAIVGGVPARFIKWRFKKDVQEKLEASQWFMKDENTVEIMKDELERIVGFNIENYWDFYMKPRSYINC